ncbi:hypothetical protein BD779DRAFT_1467783 [Infundibulicybe gibba]|nr:hypothetical protein BD779DRAFT_1467783 [Infundibulicybe gibba]
MPRINDPTANKCPDFLSGPFLAIRTTVSAAQGITPEQVAITLSDAWEADQAIQVTAWDAQCQADREIENEAHQAAEDEAQRLAQQEEREEAAEKRAKDKKKPKLAPYRDNVTIADEVEDRPSQFALHKLKAFEYVELWYFSSEGCREARRSHRAQAEEAFGLTRIGPDDVMALKPVASLKASARAVPDADLTWRQMSTAKNCLLTSMAKVGWPQRYTLSLALFYHHLDCHPRRSRKDGEKILLAYHSKARLDWHEALADPEAEAFDISAINESLLRTLADEIWDDRRSTIIASDTC